MGFVMSDVTETSRPPIWLVMLPQKFSAATTCTTSDVLVEALAQPASPRVARVMAAAARAYCDTI